MNTNTTTRAQQTANAAAEALGLDAKQTATLLAVLAARTGKATREPVACGCGCGAPTQRRFAIGHDAKLKSRLLAAWRKGEAVDANTPAHEGTSDPLAALKLLGWGHFAIALAPRKAKAPVAAKTTAPVAPAREDAATKAAKVAAELEAEAVAKAERKARKVS